MSIKDLENSIKQKASDIDNQLNNLPDEQKQAVINKLDTDYGFSEAVASDLPNSEIIANLTVRVLRQELKDKSVTYPLMEFLNQEMVPNGIKDVHYRDYTTEWGSEKAYDNMKASDLNKVLYPQYRDTVQCDTEKSFQYSILDVNLNDVTLTPGLFSALVNELEYAFVRPQNKMMYQILLGMLTNTDNYDKAVTIDVSTQTEDDKKYREAARQLYAEVIKLKHPSRNTLKQSKFGTKTVNFEYQLKPENCVLVIDSSMKSYIDYIYNSNVYNLDKVGFPIENVVVVNTDEMKNYSPGNKALPYNCFLMDKEAFNMFYHYKATVAYNTTRLYSNILTYLRFGTYKYKQALVLGLPIKTA